MKRIFYLGLFAFLALSTYRCDKSDDLTPNTGGDTTTTVPSDTTTTPSDTTTTEPSDTTTTPSDTTTIEPSDTTTVPSDTVVVDPEPDRYTPVVPEDESYYYTAPTSYAKTVNIVDDYAVDNDFETDDSKMVQQAIDDVNKAGGGKVIFPAGNYTLSSIELRSNVHIEIDCGAVIRPSQRSDNRNYAMFQCFPTTVEPTENFSIVGVGGKFTIDLNYANNQNVRCIQMGNVQNFYVSNVKVLDNLTIFSAIEFDGSLIKGKIYGPRNGVVTDFENYNSEYGYGLMQMQYGVNMLFKNCYSVGGVTLRFESHLKPYIGTSCQNYIHKIVGRNITCINGHAAVMMSPHFIENGWVDMRNITGEACEYTVLAEGGFIGDDEKAYAVKNGFNPDDLKVGYFSKESVFRDIYSTFSATEAQIHPKHFSSMPASLKHLLPSTTPWNWKTGPALYVVGHDGAYSVNYLPYDIKEANGFIKEQYIFNGKYNTKIEFPTIAD